MDRMTTVFSKLVDLETDNAKSPKKKRPKIGGSPVKNGKRKSTASSSARTSAGVAANLSSLLEASGADGDDEEEESGEEPSNPEAILVMELFKEVKTCWEDKRIKWDNTGEDKKLDAANPTRGLEMFEGGKDATALAA